MIKKKYEFLRAFPRLLASVCGLSIVFSTACFQTSQNTQQNTDDANEEIISQSDIEISAPDINLAEPLVISEKPEDVALAKKIDEIIEKSPLQNARWGVFVVSLKDGRVLVAKDARKLFNPASIQKTLTAIVTLDKLGADFRWRTHVFAQNQIASDGSLDGDLTIYGEGAPDFDEAYLSDLANQLQAKGVKRIKGNIVGDESYFKGDPLGEGWTWNDLQWYYAAEASALTFRENQAGVYTDGDGKLAASTDFIHLQNALKPPQEGKKEAFGLKRGLADNEVYVWGYGGKASGRLSVHNPALWTARTFKEFLEKRGIVVEGDAKSVDWKTENRPQVENMTELAFVESKTLAEIVQRMNKRSVNIYAELLLRTIGKKFGDTAPGDNANLQEIRGDDSAGTSVIKKFLNANKVATEELQIHDGSGLSRLDFITPEAFGRALIYAAQSNFAEVFKNSLPIAATDGTLGGRLGKVKGNILAKTGTITFVNSLAGYAKTENEVLAFAIICNNVTKKSLGSAVIDSIATSLIKRSDTISNENSNDNRTNKPDDNDE